MSRFFKSAAFPILIVVVLAFFAQKLISPGERQRDPELQPSSWPRSSAARSRTVTLNTKNNRIDVELRRAARKYQTAYPDNTEQNLVNTLRAEDIPIDVKAQGRLRLAHGPHLHPAVRDLPAVLAVHHQPDAGRRLEGHVLRQVARQADVGRLAEDHLPRRGRRGRGGRGAARDQGVPREPQEVPGARRAHPQGRAALRAAGHRQDAARARRRGRGRRAVLLDLRLGLRRDVRRRGRLARARPVRAGQAELAPASSSWTRSTPSAATAAPAWAAATTSASRRSTSCSSRWTASR